MRWSKEGPESNKGQPTKSCASNTYAVRDVQQQPLIINLVFKYPTLVFCFLLFTEFLVASMVHLHHSEKFRA